MNNFSHTNGFTTPLIGFNPNAAVFVPNRPILYNPNAPEFFTSSESDNDEGYYTADEDLLIDVLESEQVSDYDDDAPIPGLADYHKAREAHKARKALKKACKALKKSRKKAHKKAQKEARKVYLPGIKKVTRVLFSGTRLSNHIQGCVQKDQLIGRIMTHFLRNDTMTKAEYYAFRGDDFRSKFNGGIKSAVSNLQNEPHHNPWLKTHQVQHGSIISVISPTEVRVQDNWKRLIQNALS